MGEVAPVIALLTDFGDSEYVGQVKGVLAAACPGAALVDLCHHISPQAIREGAWVLWASYRYFPAGTLFLAVVDPGVGTDRPAVAVQTRRYRWVGPDNGLLYPAVHEDGLMKAVRLEVPPGASPTFHGRDLFAPAAARWACGAPLSTLGQEVEGLSVPLEFYRGPGRGEVIRVDRFGNLVTTIPGDPAWRAGTRMVVRVEAPRARRLALRLVRTYAEGAPGEVVALVGSAGTLEISVVGGSAARRLRVGPAARLALELPEG